MSDGTQPGWVVFNGRTVWRDEATVSPLGDGFMAGFGVFTTLAVRAGRPVFFAEHLERLSADAQAVGLAGPPDPAGLRERCERCLLANGVKAGALKIVWFQDVAGCGELILSRLIPAAAALAPSGARLLTVHCSPRAVSPLWRHKTLSRLEHFQAKRSALAAGYDEALWIDAYGQLLETATGNIYLVRHGEIHTPPLDAGILPGVARRVLLRSTGLPPIREINLTDQALMEADEVFMTNSLIGVRPVASIDKRVFDLARNPVTQAAAAAFEREGGNGSQ
jgi:branched-subunit amino acid aminotransferase/4-amino-4-deoxychorismate lyase